jgi:hypothetical protein
MGLSAPPLDKTMNVLREFYANNEEVLDHNEYRELIENDHI